MSAQRLRDAAKVLRERAEAAKPGPWVAADEHGDLGPDAVPAWCVCQMRPGHEHMSPTEGYVTDVAQTFSDSQAVDHDATFIATVHPGVALALADWLDVATAGYLSTRLDWSPEPAALAVADLILGRD